MSLTETMANFTGGRRRRTRRTRGGVGCPYASLTATKGGGRKKRSRRRRHKSRKGGLSKQLVSLGLLGSVLALGPKKRKRSRRHHR